MVGGRAGGAFFTVAKKFKVKGERQGELFSLGERLRLDNMGSPSQRQKQNSSALWGPSLVRVGCASQNIL